MAMSYLDSRFMSLRKHAACGTPANVFRPEYCISDMSIGMVLPPSWAQKPNWSLFWAAAAAAANVQRGEKLSRSRKYVAIDPGFIERILHAYDTILHGKKGGLE